MCDQKDMDKSNKYQWHVLCTSREFTQWDYVLWLVTRYASALQSCFTTCHLAGSCWINWCVDLCLWHTDIVYYHFLHVYFLHKDTRTQLGLTQSLHAGGSHSYCILGVRLPCAPTVRNDEDTSADTEAVVACQPFWWWGTATHVCREHTV